MPTYISNSRWNTILTKLNTKRTDADFSSISLTFSGKVKQSDIDTLRDGTIDILTYYGYTDLEEALNNLGYAYSTWKTWTRNWIATRSLDEIEDILDSLHKAVIEFEQDETHVVEGEADNFIDPDDAYDWAITHNLSIYTCPNVGVGTKYTKMWKYPCQYVEYSDVKVYRCYWEGQTIAVPKAQIGKMFYKIKASWSIPATTEYSSISIYYCDVDPSEWTDPYHTLWEDMLWDYEPYAGVLCTIELASHDVWQTFEVSKDCVNSYGLVQFIIGRPQKATIFPSDPSCPPYYQQSSRLDIVHVAHSCPVTSDNGQYLTYFYHT